MNDIPANAPRAARQRRPRDVKAAETVSVTEPTNPIVSVKDVGDDAQQRRLGDAIAPAPAPASAFERPPMRTGLRDVSPRAAAEARAAEIMEHLGGVEEGSDEFYVNPKDVPDGWTYEWKRNTVYGQSDPAYQVALARMGWEAVPAARHPEMMPADWAGGTIERKGQILMERPKSVTDLVMNRDKQRARDQVRFKEEQLSSAPSKDQLPRSKDPGGDPRTQPKITKSYEPMPVPADK